MTEISRLYGVKIKTHKYSVCIYIYLLTFGKIENVVFLVPNLIMLSLLDNYRVLFVCVCVEGGVTHVASSVPHNRRMV